MQISFQDTEQLTKLLTVTVSPEDYKSKVEAELKRLKKNMQLPGFRPGTVPENIIRRRFGKSIVSEEVSNFINKGIKQGIEQIGSHLGEAVDVEGQRLIFDVDNLNKNYQYTVEVAETPVVNIADVIALLPTLPSYNIIVEEKHIDLQIASFKNKFKETEETHEGALENWQYAHCLLKELDENNFTKKDGFEEIGTIALDLIEDAQIKTLFTNAHIGDELIIENFWDIYGKSKLDTANDIFKNIANADADALSSHFQVIIKRGSKTIEPILDESFFEEKIKDPSVKNEAELRAKYNEILIQEFEKETQLELGARLRNYLYNNFELQLPDAFLKKWLYFKKNNEQKEKGKLSSKKITPELLERDYPFISKQIKWDILNNLITETAGIKATKAEISDAIWAQYSEAFPDIEPMFLRYFLQSKHDEQLQDKEKVRNISENIIAKKVLIWLAQQGNSIVENVTLDEFRQKMKNYQLAINAGNDPYAENSFSSENILVEQNAE